MNTELAEKKWADLKLLQNHYKKFEDLLHDVITDLLGFNCTDMQLDIGKYVAYGPKYRMVQAQRGEAKTTITAIYAVWRLIHNPRSRILIVSAGSDLATEIANWVIQIINNMPELECLRPDTQAGDRASVKAFDVHHLLKGAEKSPSVACIGITSSMQGRRADVLIADDIESSKNSQTALMREKLAHLTRDFISICSTGDIIYLGTPQNNDSVYNSLPSRGFDVRIWPGRYPTVEQLPNYNGFLAPYLLRRLEADPSLQTGGGPTGDDGQPTDPALINEELLTAKQLDQGPAYFQLQHMLNTRLMDEDRYPLKARKLLFMNIATHRVPIVLNWSQAEANRIPIPQGFPIQESYYQVGSVGEEYGTFTGTHMYVDPAGGGQNGDEIAYAVTKFCGGYVFVVDIGGLTGGPTEANMEKLTEVAVKWQPQTIEVEENYGKGMFLRIWQPTLLKKHKCSIVETWETGQKELRIIDVLEPIINLNRLVIDRDLIEADWKSVQKYPVEKRSTYSVFFQLSRITRDKGALMHDDRLDALASSVRYWAEHLAQDRAKMQAKIKNENYRNMIKNPLGNGRKLPNWGGPAVINSLTKWRKR